MIDVRLLRSDPDAVAAALGRRHIDLADLERVRSFDDEQRRIVIERDDLRNRVKAVSREVGTLRREGRTEEAEARQAESRALGEQEKGLAARADELAAAIRDLLLNTPNLPSPDAPDGGGEHDNVVVRTVGFDPGAYGDHQRVPHWEIGEQLGILDLERAAKIAGSMFVMYRGFGARLVRALTQWALDRHADAFEEIRPPTLVRTETMLATGQLPKFAEDAYHLERDDLWAIPTAEAPLTSIGRDEVVDEGDLPMRFTAYTSCYRREAGAAGKDTRGLLRSHEFDKVEILAYCTPTQAADVHADMLGRAESMLADLGLAYRVVDLCTGDLGFSSARTFDLEAYAPGVDRWLEVSSVSWFSDFQARRGNLRYRPASGSGTELVHTLNGSALAWPRVFAALVETHRRPDGSIALPACLHPYLGGVTEIPAP